MVAFHDRRPVALADPKDVSPGMSMGPGERIARRVINDRFIVKSNPAKEGRYFSVHEALPSGHVIERGSGFDTRYAAKKAARGMEPSDVHEL